LVAFAVAVLLAATPTARADDPGVAFARAMTVLSSPRCINCHHDGDTPRQGDAGRIHAPPVRRGEDGRGVANLRCVTCHKDTNNAATGIPGSPDWRMAQPGMAWNDRTPAQVCAALKVSARDLNLPVAALVAHMESDPQVRWAWEPGIRRAPPPLAHDEFVAAIRTWTDAGAPCPD
jgi:hypothetical protein